MICVAGLVRQSRADRGHLGARAATAGCRTRPRTCSPRSRASRSPCSRARAGRRTGRRPSRGRPPSPCRAPARCPARRRRRTGPGSSAVPTWTTWVTGGDRDDRGDRRCGRRRRRRRPASSYVVVRTPALPLVAMTVLPLTSPGSSTSCDSNGIASVTVSPPVLARVTRTTSPSTAVASSGTDTWSPSSSTRPMSRSAVADRGGAAHAVDDLAVDHEVDRLQRRDAQHVRGRATRTGTPTGARRRRAARGPSTASPTVSAVVQTVRSAPSTSTVELAAVPHDDLAGARDRLVQRRGRRGRARPPRCPPLASTSPTVRPKASTSTGRAVDVDRDRLVQDRERAGRAGDDARARPPGPPRARHVDHGVARRASRAPGRGLTRRCPLGDGDASVLDAAPDRNRSVTDAVTRGPPCGTGITRLSADRPGIPLTTSRRPPRTSPRARRTRPSSGRPVTSATVRTVPGQQVGRVRAAAERVHGQVRRVGLDEQQAGGHLAQRRAQLVVRAERHRARERAGTSRARRASRAIAASPEKQWNTVRSGAPSRQQHLDDLVVRVPVVDLQRQARAPWPARCARGTPRAAPRGPAARRGSGPGRSRRSRGSRGLARATAATAAIASSSADLVPRLRVGVEPVRRHLAHPRVQDRLVRVDRDGAEQLRVRRAPPRRSRRRRRGRSRPAPSGSRRRPPRARGARRGRLAAVRRVARSVQPSARHVDDRVQVGVVVDDRDAAAARAAPASRARAACRATQRLRAAGRAPPRRSSRRAW